MKRNKLTQFVDTNQSNITRPFSIHIEPSGQYITRADCRLAPSQRETSLQSNAVCHWLGANLESAQITKWLNDVWWYRMSRVLLTLLELLDTIKVIRNVMLPIPWNGTRTAHWSNKANLRDLIAATGLVILLKLDLNRRFFSPCDLDIWWMTPNNNRAPLLCYFKLFASFRSHWWIQTEVTVRKRPIWVKCYAFRAVWPWNLTDDLQKQ